MIHQYQLGGFNILLDVNSGAVHLLDELTYEMAALLEPPLADSCPAALHQALDGRFGAQAVEEGYQELLQLYRGGTLFSVDDYAQFDKITALSPVKAMCLHIAHDCNMRCAYCFASSGEYHGERALMSEEVAHRAIDYLLRYSEGRHNLEVDFFGGEPLMNFDVVRSTVEYARSKEKEFNKNFRFTITTNGLLLDDEKIDFINREMHNVVLSIDGRREVNDRMRTRLDGSGTHDAILPRFRRLVEKRGDGQYYVRGTFTRYNLDFAEDVLHLNEEGFDQISVEPVVTDPTVPYAIRPEDLPAVFREYERLAQLILQREQQGKWFNFFHFMIDLEQGPCAIKRLRGCGCGNEYVAVTPQGDVYPCHQFVGYEQWKMGDVFSQALDGRIKQQFARSTVYGKEECRNCWAKFYCSGGCNANAMIYNGDITKPHSLSCQLEKKRVECAIMIKAAQAQWQAQAGQEPAGSRE